MSDVTFQKFGHTIEVKEDGKRVGGYTTGGMHSRGAVFLSIPFGGWPKKKVKQVVEKYLKEKK